MNSRKSDVSKICKNLDLKVLEKTEASIIYEMQASSCVNQADQHVLARMIKGKDGLHLVSYAEKANKIDPKTREQWLASLRDSKVVAGGN